MVDLYTGNGHRLGEGCIIELLTKSPRKQVTHRLGELCTSHLFNIDTVNNIIGPGPLAAGVVSGTGLRCRARRADLGLLFPFPSYVCHIVSKAFFRQDPGSPFIANLHRSRDKLK